MPSWTDIDHTLIDLASPAFYAPVTNGSYPDQLSTEGVSTFLDFDNHDGFAPENFDVSISQSAGITQDWNLASSLENPYWNGPAHSNEDFTSALPSGTGNNDDWDLAWSLQQHQTTGHVEQEQPGIPVSWIQPGLSPYADEQLSLQPAGGVLPDVDSTQNFIRGSALEDFSGLCLDLKQRYDNIGPIHDGLVTSSRPTGDMSATDIKPLTISPLEVIQNSAEGNQRPIPATSTKKRRTRISNAAKKILNEHFGMNPYPTEMETSALESSTRLPGRTIRTWFSNTRSRKKVPDTTSSAASINRVSRASLEALEKVSPASSMESLQRYLAQPTSEEPVRLDAVIAGKDLAAMDVKRSDSAQGASEQSPEHPPMSRRGSSTRAGSVAGSDSSRGSANSHTSQKSFRSVDSRGSRRGRKLWKRSQTSLNGDARSESGVRAAGEVDTPTSSAPNPKRRAAPYYCTWPTCDARFQFRSEWTRHEEAVHYQPYQWICCLEDTYEKLFGQCFICGRSDATFGHIATEHFNSCTNKARTERTFYRRDQFIQHIKGTHAFSLSDLQGEYVLTDLARHWEVAAPPSPDIQRLTCGFCGTTCETWQARQDHVFKHIQSGICKQSWWPNRKRLPHRLELDLSGGKCGNCGTHCDRATDAPNHHSSCVAWSCRYLQDWHAIYTTLKPPEKSTFACQLCDFTLRKTVHGYRALLERHAKLHSLRSCAQHRFTDLRSFATHLEAEHRAEWKTKLIITAQPWKCTQKIRATPEEPVMITTHMYQESVLCASKGLPFNDD